MNRSVLAAALLAISLPGHAQKPAENAIVWQSRNENFEQLTKEFAGLYRDLLSLLASGRTLPTTTAEVPSGKTITAALRERQLFDGKYLPKQLDILVCKLNPDVCTVHKGKSGNEAADDASAQWKLKPDQAILVPDIDIKAIVVHKPYVKNVGDTLKRIVVDERRGCEVYDDSCVQYVQNLNRRLDAPLDNAYAGRITVPTKAYRAVIPVTLPPPAGQPADSTKLWKASEAAKSAAAPPRSTPGDAARMVPAMAPKLSDRVIPPSRVIQHSNHTTPPAGAVIGSRAVVLKLIRHPFSKTPSLVLPKSAKANVAVFDSWVDKDHCLFLNVTVLDPEKLGVGVKRAPSCGDSGNATKAQDHGTHVVGMIGTRLDAKHGPGINPYATIRVLSVNFDNFKLPLYLAKQTDRLRELYETAAPDVVNLSFEYTLSAEQGNNDVLHAFMKDQERETLFVVSAGNDGTLLTRDGECRLRPACFDDKNIVAVAALDLNEAPGVMSIDGGKSNYGERVHLAAPGQNILSTIAGDRMGFMNGTSQAAPVVAGAASLLYLYERRLQPSQVKNRLIYTSDLFPGLYDKVQGGRLNVQRLLAYKTAFVEATGGRRLEGSVRDPNKVVHFTDFDTSTSLPLQFAQIRRLAINAGHGYYTLFYTEEVGRDTGVLKRRFVTLKSTGTTVSFGVPTNPGEPDKREVVKMKDIVDYVSPLLL